MNKIIVFDFMRTLYDPDEDKLIDGALGLIQAAQRMGYSLVLLSKTGAGRVDQLIDLGIVKYFNRIMLVNHKTLAMMQSFLTELGAIASDSFVIGDRAQHELRVGNAAGMQTIWYRQGKFAEELPIGYQPTHTINALESAISRLA